MSHQIVVRPIWTPEDTAALRALAEEFPREVGTSEHLADLAERASK